MIFHYFVLADMYQNKKCTIILGRKKHDFIDHMLQIFSQLQIFLFSNEIGFMNSFIIDI